MKGHILKIINEKYGQVSFLKFSTPNSGQGPYSKVIFLVFKNNGDYPFLCVKTVRKAADNDTIRHGFNKLELLHKLVKDSDFEQMFPQPVLIKEDDNGIIFSIETACKGFRPENSQLQQILDAYQKQQYFLFSQHPIYIEDFDQYVKNMIQKLELKQDEENKLWAYYKDIIINTHDLKVPRIPQHGDLTFDNIFIDQNSVHIFDCERFNSIDIVGFDIFHLLYRNLKDNDPRLFSSQMHKHLGKLDSHLKFTSELLFVYLLNEIYIKKKTLLNKLSTSFIKQEYSTLRSFL